MTGDIKNITISVGLGQTQMGTAFGIVLNTWSPRSARSITLIVNASVDEYKEHAVDTPELQVRNFAVMSSTDDTQKLFFDLEGQHTHSLTIGGKAYEIRFMNFTQRPDRGDYEFMITEE